MIAGLSDRSARSLLALLLIIAPGVVFAAEAGKQQQPSEVIFLVQIVLLLTFGRLLGEGMQRIGHPAVMGQLIAGVLLGPSVFGTLLPDLQQAIFPNNPEQRSMIDAVSQLGVLMLLLLTGMETDLSVIRNARRAAVSVSIFGIVVPFTCGVTLGELLPDAMLPNPDQRLITSLFLGTALSISSVKIVAMVIREMDFMRRNIGQIIMAAAITDDTIGWIIIAIIFSLALEGGLNLISLGQSVFGTALFLVASFTFGRRLVFLAIRWANDTLISDVPVITVILVVMCTMAIITHAIGVHSVLGAFIAGILIGQSPILTKHIDEQLRGLIVALFMPIFFGLAGLHADLSILANPSLLLLAVGLIAIASVGKFIGAFVGGAIGGLTWRQSLAVGCGMNARGSTEVIVATIGLSMGALSQDLFTMIVAMALVTTMAMPPMLRWALRRLPLADDEKARLEREAFEAGAFAANLERLLVAVDESAGGRLASRLIGLLASSRRMPITALSLAAGSGQRDAAPSPEFASIVKATVEAAEKKEKNTSADEGNTPASVDITVRQREELTEQAVTREASKGYGLLVIGIEPTMADDGTFDGRIARIATDFEGPFAIVVARGKDRAEPVGTALNVLVPITGTSYSRRGAELALAVAGAAGGSITALYVGTPAKKPRSWRRRRGEHRASSSNQEAILSEVVWLGQQHGVAVTTTVREASVAGDAIVRESKAGRHDLIVMGVSARAADTLFFGEASEIVLQQSSISMVFLSS